MAEHGDHLNVWAGRMTCTQSRIHMFNNVKLFNGTAAALDFCTFPLRKTAERLLPCCGCHSASKATTCFVLIALQEQAGESLDADEYDQVLAMLLPCQQAVRAQLSTSGQLQLEAWCHRTARVPVLPPTQQQRQPDSDYRQAAFCIRWGRAAEAAVTSHTSVLTGRVNCQLLL